QDAGGGGLPMGTGNSQTVGVPGDDPQHLRAFFYGEAPLFEEVQPAMGGGYRRGVDHQGGAGIPEAFPNELHAILEMYLDPQFDQFVGDRGRGSVIAGHSFANELEIPGQGGHADAPDPYQIY